MKQLRLYQGYSSSKAKALYEQLVHDMGRYGKVFIGNEILNFIENPFEFISKNAMIVLDATNKENYTEKVHWNELLNKIYSQWKDDFKCSLLIFTNDHISKTLVRDPKIEYKRI